MIRDWESSKFCSEIDLDWILLNFPDDALLMSILADSLGLRALEGWTVFIGLIKQINDSLDINLAIWKIEMINRNDQLVIKFIKLNS